jgi:hypothetical protein
MESIAHSNMNIYMTSPKLVWELEGACDVWGSHSSVDKYLSLVGCYTSSYRTASP